MTNGIRVIHRERHGLRGIGYKSFVMCKKCNDWGSSPKLRDMIYGRPLRIKNVIFLSHQMTIEKRS